MRCVLVARRFSPLLAHGSHHLTDGDFLSHRRKQPNVRWSLCLPLSSAGRVVMKGGVQRQALLSLERDRLGTCQTGRPAGGVYSANNISSTTQERNHDLPPGHCLQNML